MRTWPHSFIGADYWKSNYEFIKEMIPKAEVYVAEASGKIGVFFGLTDTYISGFIAKKTEQSKSVGNELIHAVMETIYTLCLNIYKKNTKAVMFYQRCCFIIVNLRPQAKREHL